MVTLVPWLVGRMDDSESLRLEGGIQGYHSTHERVPSHRYQMETKSYFSSAT